LPSLSLREGLSAAELQENEGDRGWTEVTKEAANDKIARRGAYGPRIADRHLNMSSHPPVQRGNR
jgi:hypothetical protein